MNRRYIAFDVETPNYANNRMSAIGITVVEHGAVVQAYETLVNPECGFDPFNISLTGITPEMTAHKPPFPALWQEIEPLMSSGLLIAHNAPFDMSVLAKCLRDYGISWRPTVPYACTCQYLGLELDHHQAGSDSRACGEVLLHCLRSGGTVEPSLRTYDLTQIRTLPARRRKG